MPIGRASFPDSQLTFSVGRVRFFVGLVAAAVAACSSMPPPVDTSNYTPLVLAPATMVGVIDRRADFRAFYCTEDRANEQGCPDVLRKFRDEGHAARVPLVDESRRGSYLVAIALGVGWDCAQSIIDEPELPSAALQDLGFDTRLIEVEGLSGSHRNADIVFLSLLDDLADSRPLILIGYSKGANDLLVALSRFPQLAARTAAFVSVAGAIGGSPVAENASAYTEKLLHFSPFGDCGVGDGQALASLRPRVRHAWLKDHLPLAVPSYSIITAPEPARVSRALHSPYKLLSIVHPLNDGALFHWDQLLPRSTLLGYANADHWAVSVPLRVSEVPFGQYLTENEYDRLGLWRSMLDFVIADLGREL
ncbi:MAG TPA: hypothetical protein DCP75_16950 [Haliea salexigens]|uniref:Alpha/beta hydrolase n=1 Tax=Haliea salexigens TaxID=287487 RepID=A0A3C1KSS1_9GAMM|nr:hypothetical protein [Haliea sp.]HAN29374.1 hypothetical protein [Haliea salexigens]|tara:strand:+ start:939 stop:2030 length:1092 start_codon:yes stop_codon:yes gene_type:complete